MGLVFRKARVERYVPDVLDNRKQYEAGEPDAVIVTLREPDVYVWRKYQGVLLRKRLGQAQREKIELDDTDVPALDEEAEGDLFRSCVLTIDHLALEDGTPIKTGAEFWDQRRDIAREVAEALITDLIAALLIRARLDAGTVANLERRSGLPVSAAPTDGTVETAGVGA